MTGPSHLDGVLIAHVADELQRAHGVEDYDLAADHAASLLAAYPYLVTAADAYANRPTCELAECDCDAYAVADFRQAVATAVALNDSTSGGF